MNKLSYVPTSSVAAHKISAAAAPPKSPLPIRILSNIVRYEILRLLLHAKRDLCVHELADEIGVSQSATSHQLSYLEAHGVVESVRMGKSRCYVPTNSPIVKKISKIISVIQ